MDSKEQLLMDLMVQAAVRPWEQDCEPFQVGPQVYYVGNTWVGAYLIETKEGLILIDATLGSQVYLVFEGIRKLGFNPKDIKIVLLSHAHYDHCGGLRQVLEYAGAKLYMGKEDEFMIDRPDLVCTLGFPFGEFKAYDYFDDNKSITLGEVTIHTIHTPGHTPGTHSIFFEIKDNEGKGYHYGMHGGIGLNTLSDEYFTESGMSATLRQEYIKSLHKVENLEIDIALGSHPNQTDMMEKAKQITNGYNPFYDKSAWKKLIRARIKMYEDLYGK